MADAAISVQGVSKHFRLHGDRPQSIKERLTTRPGKGSGGSDFHALTNVFLDVPKGSFMGLIGHNGSGKSTLLRLMAGIHKPNGGQIVVDGRISALLELGSGFHPDLTGRENIYLNGAILGIPRSEMAKSVEEIVKFSGIGEFIDVPIKAYSSGMYVRLGFAVAVNVNPEILLVDEVIAVGDEDFQRRCLDHMYKLRRQGVTIVFVSHAISLVQQLCDHVAWMDHGVLQMVGDPAEVCNAYMAHVNSIESARIQAEQADEGDDDAETVAEGQEESQRRGTGEIEINRIEFFDPDGNSVPAIGVTGEPLTVRLFYQAAERLELPVFVVDIFHESGTHVAGPSSVSVGTPLEVVEAGPGYVDCVFDEVLLNPGNFYLSTAIFDSSQLHCFDHWLHAAGLIIQPGVGGERAGLVVSGARYEQPVAL